jgi:chromate reductase, NAD(P)H dehydrogenase (quinone)
VFLNVPTIVQPGASIGHADKLFDAECKLAGDETRKFLQSFIQALDAWITANAKL